MDCGKGRAINKATKNANGFVYLCVQVSAMGTCSTIYSDRFEILQGGVTNLKYMPMKCQSERHVMKSFIFEFEENIM